MRKRTVAAIAAGLAITYTQISLLVMFGQFGVDLGFNPTITRSPGGGYVFFFEGGHWEQHKDDQYGGVDGILFVDGVGHSYSEATGDSGLVLTLAPPQTIRFSAKDSRGRLSGDIEVFFDDCDPDSTMALVSRIGRADSLVTYRFRAFTDSAALVMDSLVDNRTRSLSWLSPGNYQLYWAMIDEFGLQGQWIGPVRIQMDECPTF